MILQYFYLRNGSYLQRKKYDSPVVIATTKSIYFTTEVVEVYFLDYKLTNIFRPLMPISIIIPIAIFVPIIYFSDTRSIVMRNYLEPEFT